MLDGGYYPTPWIHCEQLGWIMEATNKKAVEMILKSVNADIAIENRLQELLKKLDPWLKQNAPQMAFTIKSREDG